MTPTRAERGTKTTVAVSVEARYQALVSRARACILSQLLVLSFTLGGCAYKVAPTSPRPNILITVDKAPSDLLLGPAIQDNFEIPRSNTFLRDIRVRGWRQTLDAAFGNAFVRGAGSGRKLSLREAELWFSYVRTPFWGIVANIRYKAIVVDPSGREIGGFAGQAMSKEPIVFESEDTFSDAATTAVEVMYEQLTAYLLTQL